MIDCAVDPLELRKEFNSTIKPQYKETHTPQCQRCMRFHKWGNSIMHVHHKKALCDGGTNEYENLVTLCCDCHEEWHMRQETRIPFDEWMHRVPLYVYSAIGMTEDVQLKKEMFSKIDEIWWRVKEKRMVTEPWTDENKKYTEKNCSKWIDW